MYRQPVPWLAPRRHKQHACGHDQYEWSVPVLMHQKIRVLTIESRIHVHAQPPQPPHTCAEMGLSSSWSTPVVLPTADAHPRSLQCSTPGYFSQLAALLWRLYLNAVFATLSPRYHQPYMLKTPWHCWSCEFSSPGVSRVPLQHGHLSHGSPSPGRETQAGLIVLALDFDTSHSAVCYSQLFLLTFPAAFHGQLAEPQSLCPIKSNKIKVTLSENWSYCV